MRIFSYIMLVLLLGSTACSPSTPEKNTAAATPGACRPPVTWSIEFQRTGGLAGFMQALALSSDGKVVATDLRVQQSVSATLTEDEMKTIATLLAQNCPFQIPRSETTCADCFTYTLKITMDGTPYQVSLTDVNMPQSMAPLIEMLAERMQKMLFALPR